MQNIEIWKILAGLGFFLYGMSQLETVLRSISGRSLKLFLKRNTKSLFKSISGGAIITGIIQSSSVVSLIVLAFVESGIITFRNALGVILGANLGTTLSSWIFATVGFNVNVLDLSLPIIAISTILMFFFEKRRKLYNLFAIFFSLGILFLGLGFMKEGALTFVENFDLKSFNHYGIFVFSIVGFILTTIIQSSSATVAITLTAIYAGVITFPFAAAIVIGSEIGTTIKILLWGIKGSADKRRVAWGNFIYNIFTAGIAFLTLRWLIYFIENILHIKDPLIALVAFQTAINIVSIILFIPFLNIFANWLANKFKSVNGNENSYIGQNLPVLPILASDALRNEALNLFKKTLSFNKNILCLEKSPKEGLFEDLKSFTLVYTDIEVEYNRLKQTEGDILEYYTRINENKLETEDSTLMLHYVNVVRLSIYAAKAIKDIAHNLKNFDASANDMMYQQCQIICIEWLPFHNRLNQLLNLSDKNTTAFEIDKLMNDALLQEEVQKSEIMLQLKNNQLNKLEASTLMNVHRELLSCKKSLLTALGNLTIETLTDIKLISTK